MQKNNHFDNSAKIPKWLLTTDEYTPPKDKDNFWQKTLFSITTKLIFLRHHNYPHKNSWLNPSEKLLFIFLTIILINSAQKIFFPLIILAFSLICLSTLNTKIIISILKPTLISTLFSLIIILPSLLLNNTRLFYLPFKIFITVLLLAYIAQTIPFYRLSKILRLFHIPAIFILTLDLTLKYIVILGDTFTNLLISLKLRSVGKNNFKYQSLASISGTTFLKSQIYTKETYHAMICRCFDENYTPVIKHKFKIQKL